MTAPSGASRTRPSSGRAAADHSSWHPDRTAAAAASGGASCATAATSSAAHSQPAAGVSPREKRRVSIAPVGAIGPPAEAPIDEDAPLIHFSVGSRCEAGAATAEVKALRAKQQRRAKARRILREAIRLAREEAAANLTSSRDFQRLVRVAIDIRKASDALEKSDLLTDLGESQLAMIASSGKRRMHKRYTALYREGSPATCFYILKAGAVHEHSLAGVDRTITVERRADAQFVLFGMEALLGRPRACTVDAMEDVDIIKFSAVDLNIREDGAAKVARKVFNAFVESELSQMTLFNSLSTKQLKQVAALFFLEEVASGTVIFKAGSPGDKVYIVMHGNVEIRKGSKLLSTLRAEQGCSGSSELGLPVFGEMAMLDRKPRVADVKAVSDCKLLVLPYEQFAACMLIVPDMKLRLKKLKEMRNRQNEKGALKRAGLAPPSPARSPRR